MGGAIASLETNGKLLSVILNLFHNALHIQSILRVQQIGRTVRDDAIGNSNAQNAGRNSTVMEHRSHLSTKTAIFHIQSILRVQQIGRTVRDDAIGNSNAQNAGRNSTVMEHRSHLSTKTASF